MLLDNATNYRKDALQLRVLRPGLGTGLLTVDGEGWRAQRRALAPLFSPRQVADFAPAMHRVARALVERIGVGRDGRPVEVSEEMARTALEVLEQTLFSQGLARGASEFQRAVTALFQHDRPAGPARPPRRAEIPAAARTAARRAKRSRFSRARSTTSFPRASA